MRQNLRDFTNSPYDYYVILSGDQLYRMDYREMLQQHIETGAELTIATIPVKGMTPDVVDDHYYKREQGMFEESRHYAWQY